MTVELPATGWWTVHGKVDDDDVVRLKDTKDYTWRTGDGDEIPVHEMKTSHVKNCIGYLEQRMTDYGEDTFPGVASLSCSQWIDIFIAELARRKCTRSTVFRDAVDRVKDRKRGVKEEKNLGTKTFDCPTCHGECVVDTHGDDDCPECEGAGIVTRKVKRV